MDLTGRALKMQRMTQMAAQPAGGVTQTTQTTIAIPPPTEFARSAAARKFRVPSRALHLSFGMFAMIPVLIDPESGRNLGAPDKLIGEVVIENVEAQYSTARVVAGGDFKRNHVVRLKGQAAKP